MKHIAKYSLRLWMAMALSLLCLACEKDANFKEYAYPVPEITGIFPASGYVGSQVAILGKDFGDQIEAVKVTFGGMEARNVFSCTDGRIIVELPDGAQSGKVGVQVWNHAVESEDTYTVIPTPMISSIKSLNSAGDLFATANDEVLITGNNFGDAVENVSVVVKGLQKDVQASVVAVTNEEIRFKLPADYDESGTVFINVGGYEVEGSALINPAATGDVTALFLKNYKQPFLRGDVSDSEWGTALYWLTSDGFGSSLQYPEVYPEGLLAIQSGWGQGKKENAKLYQLATLPPGKYTFTVHVVENTNSGGRYGAVFAVVEGEGVIPDLNDEQQNLEGAKQWTYNPVPEEVLGWKHVTIGSFADPADYQCEVTLTQTTAVTIGFVAMMNGSSNVKISDIKIERN